MSILNGPLLYLLLISIELSVNAQEHNPAEITNSFEAIYKKSHPDLIYDYDEVAQIHDYSGNWDLDRDGIKDKLYFIGNNGAHLYYYLNITLSSDSTIQAFPFLQTDAPFLIEFDDLVKSQHRIGFAVSDSSGTHPPGILMGIDYNTLLSYSHEFAKYHLKHPSIYLQVEKGIITFRSY